MIKRGSPLNARKNNAKPSAKPSQAAAQNYVIELAKDSSAAIAEGVRIAALPAPASAPASAPAPASVPEVSGAQLPAAIKGVILSDAGRDRANCPREKLPRMMASPTPRLSILALRRRLLRPLLPASAPAPAHAPAPALAATRTAPSVYNW